ncbi:PKD domain-containing protein [Geobacter pickeringii]|nr:PKD domain-containing protein [Geobacter pickeringii]
MITLWVVAVVLLAGPLGGHEALALTAADCKTCHTGDPVTGSMAPTHHALIQTKGLSCYAGGTTTGCHNLLSNGSGGFTIEVVHDCIVCHGQKDHLAQHNMLSTAADCVLCHTQTPVAEHLSRTSTCFTCHNSTKPEVQSTIAAGKAGTPVTCINCHGAINHIAQHDKVTTPADCLSCHNQGVVYEHINRHSTCATCHSSTNATVQQTIAAGRAGTTVFCTSCHGAVNHIAQHDKVQTAPECAQCHTKTVLDEHLTRTSTCSTCHSSSRIDVQNTIAAGRAGTVVTCVNCHGQYNHPTAHTGKVNVPYADCSGCHTAPLTDLHARRGFQCAACHASSNTAVTATVQKGLGGQPVVCADCHSSIGGFGNHAGQHDMVTLPAGSPGFIQEHEAKNVYCVACHSYAGTALDKATVATAINNGMKGVAQSCNSCHPGYGNQPPVASAGPDQTVAVNQSVSFSGAGSSDPDGTIVSYAWSFGDGTTASGVSATKTYTAAGTYTVTLTVTDNVGATATDTALVTVQAQAGSIFSDEVLYLQRLNSVTSSDSNSQNITTVFQDGNLTDRYLLQNTSGSSSVVSMKLNRDALGASKVILRLYVSSISSSRTIKVYPYQSNGTSVNTSYSASATTSTTGWVAIDVTSIAQRMNGYGWMKFRVTTSGTLYAAEGAFQVQ